MWLCGWSTRSTLHYGAEECGVFTGQLRGAAVLRRAASGEVAHGGVETLGRAQPQP